MPKASFVGMVFLHFKKIIFCSRGDNKNFSKSTLHASYALSALPPLPRPVLFARAERLPDEAKGTILRRTRFIQSQWRQLNWLTGKSITSNRSTPCNDLGKQKYKPSHRELSSYV